MSTPGNFFKKKKVLITGISGFVGSQLAQKLGQLGADVYGIARSKSDRNVAQGDILDASFVENICKSFRGGICFHLAGKSLVEEGQRAPYDTYMTNIVGTLNVLENARKFAFERVIIASTSHVYGHNRLPYYEGYVPRPSRPYETSKACTDLIAQSYASSFNLPVFIGRFVNIYGPGDRNFERLIPRTIRTVLSHRSPLMWGGSAVRDYLYIDDAVDGYLKLATVDFSKVGDNRIFNFGGGNRISVKELITLIITLSGQKVSIKKINEERSEEIPAQYLAFSKAAKLLDWKAHVSLRSGLTKTLAWYKQSLRPCGLKQSLRPED